MERFFELSERGTTVGTEVKAGVTTFMVMVYIVAVNPLILIAGPLGSTRCAAAAATALVAGVMTIPWGSSPTTRSPWPRAWASTRVVAFGLSSALGMTPPGAMGVIVMEGVVVTMLVLVGLREAIMNAVPLSLKRAIAVGIGLFILFIGFVDGGLIAGRRGDGPVPVEFIFPNSDRRLGLPHRPGHHHHPVGAQGAGARC